MDDSILWKIAVGLMATPLVGASLSVVVLWLARPYLSLGEIQELKDRSIRVQRLAVRWSWPWWGGVVVTGLGAELLRMVYAQWRSRNFAQAEWEPSMVTIYALATIALAVPIIQWIRAKRAIARAIRLGDAIIVFRVQVKGLWVLTTDDNWRQEYNCLFNRITHTLEKEKVPLGLRLELVMKAETPPLGNCQDLLAGLEKIFNKDVAPTLSDHPELVGYQNLE